MLKQIKKNRDKFFLGIIAVIVIIVLFYGPIDQSYFGVFLEQISDVNWDEVRQRNIVKNSIPIILIEQTDKNCKVSAENFEMITSHEYFVRSEDLVKELNYDREHKTLTLQCSLLTGEKSRLNVWYVVEESPNHSKKYQYFVTPWNETSSG